MCPYIEHLCRGELCKSDTAGSVGLVLGGVFVEYVPCVQSAPPPLRREPIQLPYSY
jgi:hypothetical protein